MTLKPKQSSSPFHTEHTIIVDPGKHNVKVLDIVNGDVVHAFKFPSKALKVKGFSGFSNGSEFHFQFEHDNERWIVGEVVNGEYSYDTTKVTRHHQVCIYTAIARLIEDGEIINLIIGSPSSDFKNSTVFNEYVELMRGDKGKEIEVTLDGQTKAFTIRDFAIYPEGMALYTRQLTAQKNKMQEAYHVVDIGGQNVNYRQYDRAGNSSDARSLDKAGMNYLNKELRKALRDSINGNTIDLNAIDFDEVVETRKIRYVDQIDGFDSVEDFVTEQVYTFIQQHIAKGLADEVDFKQKGHKIIFTGGGSVRLKPYLEELYGSNIENLVFSTHPIYDNCASYFITHLLSHVQSGTLERGLGERAYADFIQQLQSRNFEGRRQLKQTKQGF